MAKTLISLFFCNVAPLEQKRVYKGCTQTTKLPAEPEIPLNVSQPSISRPNVAKLQCLNGNWCIQHGISADNDFIVMIST
jgi:hypothetical protein